MLQQNRRLRNNLVNQKFPFVLVLFFLCIKRIHSFTLQQGVWVRRHTVEENPGLTW